MSISKTKAAYLILKEKGTPLKVSEIIRIADSRNLITYSGKKPTATLSADLYLEVKRMESRGRSSKFYKVSRGVWGLTEWLVK